MGDNGNYSDYKRKGRVGRAIMLIIFIGILAAGGYFYYYRNYVEPAMNVTYVTWEITKADVVSTVTASGNIAATDEVSLYIKTSEKVSKIHVREGDIVSQGQHLIEYDVKKDLDDLKRKLATAELNLKNAELNLEGITLPASGNELLQYSSDVATANKNIEDARNAIESTKSKIRQQQLKLDDAEKTMTKNEELYESGIIVRDVVDQSILAYESLLEAMNELELQLAANESNLAYRRKQKTDADTKLKNAQDKSTDESVSLRSEQQKNVERLLNLEIEQIKGNIIDLIFRTVSPVNGTVIEISVSEGGTATRNNPVIRLADLSTMIIKVDISEFDISEVEIGQPVKIAVAGFPDYLYNGTVSRISANSEKKSGSSDDEVIIPVEITIEDPDNKLKIGYTADIEIITATSSDVVVAPSQSIVQEDGKKYVYVLVESVVEGGAEGAPTGGADGDVAETVVTPEKREITTGMYGDNGVEITSGLQPGEQILISPP